MQRVQRSRPRPAIFRKHVHVRFDGVILFSALSKIGTFFGVPDLLILALKQAALASTPKLIVYLRIRERSVFSGKSNVT